MSKALEFIGEYYDTLIENGEYVYKIKLPNEWDDDSFYGTIIVYESVILSKYDSSLTNYFIFYPDNKVSGDEHITDKKKRLTIITKDGYLMLPDDFISCAKRNVYKYVRFCGCGSCFQIRFDSVSQKYMSLNTINEFAAKFISLFDGD